MSNTTTIDITQPNDISSTPRSQLMCLVLLWSRFEPERTGEVYLIPNRLSSPCTIGRGSDAAEALEWVRIRPGEVHQTGALTDPALSREQLTIVNRQGDRLEVLNTGKLPLSVNHHPVAERCRLGVGDIVCLGDRYVLEVDKRPSFMAPCALPKPRWPKFGQPDEAGIVGESPWTWRTRSQLYHVAQGTGHVIVFGPSGSGKELVARAVHAMAEQPAGAWVARNAATIPKTLVNAELFGNAKDYPNAGMPARPGLVGAADGGALVLDEFAELPELAQASLLRVMDDGAYHRLGEDRERRTRMRLIALTNRAPEAVKHDVLARFIHRFTLPMLSARRQDLALILRHVLAQWAVDDDDKRISQRAVATLVTSPLDDNVRGLLRAVRAWLQGEDTVTTQGVKDAPISAVPTEADVKQAIAANPGDRGGAARALGLPNRFALYRLMKRLGMT